MPKLDVGETNVKVPEGVTLKQDDINAIKTVDNAISKAEVISVVQKINEQSQKPHLPKDFTPDQKAVLNEQMVHDTAQNIAQVNNPEEPVNPEALAKAKEIVYPVNDRVTSDNKKNIAQRLFDKIRSL